jgi:hypothetical protein
LPKRKINTFTETTIFRDRAADFIATYAKRLISKIGTDAIMPDAIGLLFFLKKRFLGLEIS